MWEDRLIHHGLLLPCLSCLYQASTLFQREHLLLEQTFTLKNAFFRYKTYSYLTSMSIRLILHKAWVMNIVKWIWERLYLMTFTASSYRTRPQNRGRSIHKSINSTGNNWRDILKNLKRLLQKLTKAIARKLYEVNKILEKYIS